MTNMTTKEYVKFQIPTPRAVVESINQQICQLDVQIKKQKEWEIKNKTNQLRKNK